MIEKIATNAYAAQIQPISGPTSIPEYIGELIGRALPLIGAAALAFVIYGGVQLVMSGGDPEKVTKAKKTLTWAIAGVLLIAFSYFVVVSLNSLINNNL
jgi:TRAP-type C4-dicarboxylate transport system permease small subunit